MHRTTISLLVIALLALTGCGKEAPVEAGATASAAPQSTLADTPSQAAAPRAGNDRSQLGDCDLLTADDIAEAFGSKLTVTRISGGNAGRGTGCTVSLAEGEHGEVSLAVENRSAFELRRDSAQGQSGVEMVPVDIGVEAHIINSAQVIAIDAQDRAISLGLQLIVFGQETPVTTAQSDEGMQLLARRVLERL